MDGEDNEGTVLAMVNWEQELLDMGGNYLYYLSILLGLNTGLLYYNVSTL
jgi:hypothetical protein